MISFDFITQEDFQKSLESDWAELNACFQNKAWKSVHILAGSIVEALLIDCLGSSKGPSHAPADLLKKDLADLIALCKDAGIISERTAQLSTVIRSFRNLIHPGRMIRLKEKVTEQSASIARSLVEITLAEVEEQRRKEYGFTAKQIVKKIESDSSSLPILPHLIRELNEVELNRLLLTVIPDRYFEEIQSFDERPNTQTLDHLGRCFRIAFESAPRPIKRVACQKFVSVVKESDGFYVQTYETIFFRGSDLAYLETSERELIKAHLIPQFKSTQGIDLLLACAGIMEFLSKQELAEFTSAAMRLLAHRRPQGTHQNLIAQFVREFRGIDAGLQEVVRLIIKNWVQRWEAHNTEAFNSCVDLRAEILGEQMIDEEDIPF
jgi:hypothetical protein